jgi:hypothetical protein
VFLVPIFRRVAGEASTLELPVVSALSDVAFVPPDCSCGACAGVGSPVTIHSSHFDATAKLLLASFVSDAVGSTKLCAGSVHLATVDFETAPCAFGFGAASPCQAPVCADPFSEKCVEYVAEYCGEHPEDTGCTHVVPMFVRPLFSTTNIAVHVRTSIAEIYAAPLSCKCGEASCETSAVQFFSTSVDSVEQTVSLDIAGYNPATFQFCAKMPGLPDALFARVGFLAPNCASRLPRRIPAQRRAALPILRATSARLSPPSTAAIMRMTQAARFWSLSSSVRSALPPSCSTQRSRAP